MKHIRKILPIVLIVLMLFSLVGCASSNKFNDSFIGSDNFVSDNSYNSGGFNSSFDKGDYENTAKPSEEAPSGSQNADNETSNSQKYITTYRLTIETKKYDFVMNDIKESVSNLGGYIESENSRDYGSNRNTDLILRIPTKNVNEWLDKINDYGTITSKNQTTENVTLEYVDLESRLQAYKSERDVLFNLLEKAETLNDILMIQSQLTEVNYKIESHESRLRALDDLIDYTTITLNLREVEHESIVNPSFLERIQERFNDSIDTLKEFVENSVVFVIGCSPILFIWIIIIVAIAVTIRKIRVKGRKTKTQNIVEHNDEKKED